MSVSIKGCSECNIFRSVLPERLKKRLSDQEEYETRILEDTDDGTLRKNIIIVCFWIVGMVLAGYVSVKFGDLPPSIAPRYLWFLDPMIRAMYHFAISFGSWMYLAIVGCIAVNARKKTNNMQIDKDD